jgi:hypothetical protein
MAVADAVAHDWTEPVTESGVFTQKNLVLNRLLLSIYEQDLHFLNVKYNDPRHRADYADFYAPETVALGKLLKPTLERAAFAFLDEVAVPSGLLGADEIGEYIVTQVDTFAPQPNPVLRVIESARAAATAAAVLVIQIAPDALSEASAMARTLPGVFAEEQSALMSVFMDEYGRGRHRDKHGTLYENLMLSIDLSPETHAYYEFYLPTSLMLTNYFHYLCTNKPRWFHYVGALFYLEASLPHFVAQVVPTLRRVFGAKIDTAYFDEHGHIDPSHRITVLEDLVLKSIKKYGSAAAAGILVGFEAIRRLLSLADDDVMAQLRLADTLGEVGVAAAGGSRTALIEQRAVRHAEILAEDTSFHAPPGGICLGVTGVECVEFAAGCPVILPRGRPHVVLSA